MKKALVIFNPTAGLKTKIDVEGIVREKLGNLGYEVNLIYLNHHFEDEIDKLNLSEIGLVVAVGGDGTVKVAARTIIEKKLECPLAIIPYGSANVIAIAAGLPLNIKNALKLIEEPLKTMPIDVGLVNKKHYFVVGLSIGYVSKIVISASQHLKSRLGFFGYLFTFIFNKIKIRKIKFEIKTKNRTFWIKGNSLIIFNALNYYGLKVKKPISFADGIFNLYVFTSKTFLSLVEAFFLMIFMHHPPRYVLALDNNYFKVILKQVNTSCQVDGDYLKLPKVIEVELLSKALKMVVKK